MKKANKTLLFLVSAITILFLVGCDSSDLGDARPDRVKVDLNLSGWDSGAGKVIEAKCANCHTPKRSAFVPANTPDSLDGISAKSFFMNPANKGLISQMLKRVETSDPTRQMPPRFATPLYEDEKVALAEFLASFEAPSTLPGQPSRTVKFKDIAQIVARDCGGCHDGDNAFELKTRDHFVAVAPTALDAILSGTMPRRNKGWKDSEDGKLVIDWLRGDLSE